MLNQIYALPRGANSVIYDRPQGECDSALISVHVRVNDWNKTPMRYTSRSGRFMYLFQYRWADYNPNLRLDTSSYPFEVKIVNFMAYDIRHAAKCWYRYLRLRATGATHEEAMDIVQDFVPEHLMDI